VFGERKMFNRLQSTINISSEYLWIKEKDQLINSMFPKFLRFLGFSEHLPKQIELEQINLDLMLHTVGNLCQKVGFASLFIRNTIIQMGI
jgi:hypothetical protein